jgi:transposase
MDTFIIGADMAKATFEVAVRGSEGEQAWGRFANTPAGFEQLAQKLAAAQTQPEPAPVLLVLEPTGGYELALAAFGYEAGWVVSRPNPKRVRDWAKSQGRRAKTDRVDARDLAGYGASQSPAHYRPLPPELSELDSLLGRQVELQQMLRAERNRQGALAGKSGIAPLVGQDLADSIARLEARLVEIGRAVKAHLKAHPKLQAKLKQLRSVPGIGAKNGVFILLLLARWEHLTEGRGTTKGLVAYTGLDPQTHESGTSVHKRASISRMGQAHMRRTLYMGALGGVRGHNPLREFYQGLVGRGKAKKLALTASARKIVVWAWTIYQHDTLFDPDRARSKALVPA